MMNQDNSRKIGMSTPTSILIGSVIIAAAIIFSNLYLGISSRQVAENTDPSAIDERNIVMTPATEADHVYGSLQAKVLLIEYSDTECAFCKQMHPVIKKIIDESKGEVGWVYRHFPLDSLHPKARIQAVAVECAAELGGKEKFWEYLNELFQKVHVRDRAAAESERARAVELSRIAAKIGLHKVKFAACLSSGKQEKNVEDNYQDGVRIGITGTPTIVLVNAKAEKKVFLGAQSEKVIKVAIEKLK